MATDRSSNPPIRTIVIDDHEMFADAVARALERADDIIVLAIARTAAEGVAVAATEAPDVAVVDYQLPDESGTALARQIRTVSPTTQIVLLTGSHDDRVLRAAVDDGCDGFLTKDKAVHELVAAVRCVHEGEAYLPSDRLAELLPRLRSTYRPVGAELTGREREVLELLADGKSNAAIAAELVLSRHTVRNHVQNVLTKLAAHSKLEAVAIATREGLVRQLR